MGNTPRISNYTELVFCRENVDPQVISLVLGLSPYKSVRVGDTSEDQSGGGYVSHLGIWKLALPDTNEVDTVEDQIVRWLEMLEPRSPALSELEERGYSPYLDCQAGQGALSLCIDPDLLVRLGKLGIALSIWLYEKSE
jgi:hypothetical protein